MHRYYGYLYKLPSYGEDDLETVDLFTEYYLFQWACAFADEQPSGIQWVAVGASQFELGFLLIDSLSRCLFNCFVDLNNSSLPFKVMYRVARCS